MTESEAIELIEKDLKLHSKDLSSKYKNGLRMAIQALEKQEKIAGRYEYETIEMLMKALENSKTAYDVDKVIEELELHSFELGTDTLPVHYVRLNEAIEIVKQGGVSDYVCEWRLCDEEANVYDTSCRNPHILIEGTPQENNYEFCPYCGKKIKTVGD